MPFSECVAPPGMQRRRFIAATAGVAALGGCLGLGTGGDSMADGTTTTGDGMDGGMDDDGSMGNDSMGNDSMSDGSMGNDSMGEESMGNESMGDGMSNESMDDGMGNDSMDGGMEGDTDLHTVAGTAGLADQPRLGPDPFEADAVVVAFEDPSCPNCRRFETNAFRKIRSEWTDAGKASFVFRGFPVVYPWGKPASQALEATYAHDESAFWTLKDHYFAEQDAFDEGNVLDRTETFLAENAMVDAETVVSEAREEAYDDAVQADLSAGEEAGFSATPSFLLFRDGSLVTELAGPKSFSVFENALQL